MSLKEGESSRPMGLLSNGLGVSVAGGRQVWFLSRGMEREARGQRLSPLASLALVEAGQACANIQTGGAWLVA